MLPVSGVLYILVVLIDTAASSPLVLGKTFLQLSPLVCRLARVREDLMAKIRPLFFVIDHGIHEVLVIRLISASIP